MSIITKVTLPALIISIIALVLITTVIVSNSILVHAKSRDAEQMAAPVASARFSKLSVATAPQASTWSRRSATRTESESRIARPAPPAAPVIVNTEAPTPKPAASKPVTQNAPVAAPVVATVAVPPDSHTPSFATLFQQKVIEYTNAERAKKGLTPLVVDAKLTAIAQKHSADMLANDFFSHTNKSGCDTRCRLDAAKYKWKSYGENIHWMSGYEDSTSEAAQRVVADWMDSTGHRANILNATFTAVGIGVAVEGTKIYTTADYSLPK